MTLTEQIAALRIAAMGRLLPGAHEAFNSAASTLEALVALGPHLQKFEWSRQGSYKKDWCPVCVCHQTHGHAADCWLRDLLALIGEAK